MSGIELFGLGLALYALSRKKKGNAPALVNYGKVLSYSDIVHKWKRETGLKLPETFILGIIAQESGGNPEAKGSSGEVGLMQLTYPAYVDSGVTFPFDDLVIPEKNIEAGVKYLKWIEEYLIKNGVPERELVEGTVKSYNIGIGNYMGDNLKEAGEKYWRQILKHRDIIIKRGFGL